AGAAEALSQPPSPSGPGAAAESTDLELAIPFEHEAAFLEAMFPDATPALHQAAATGCFLQGASAFLECKRTPDTFDPGPLVEHATKEILREPQRLALSEQIAFRARGEPTFERSAVGRLRDRAQSVVRINPYRELWVFGDGILDPETVRGLEQGQ